MHKRVVEERNLEPGTLLIDGRLVPMWDIPYPNLVSEFEAIGAQKVRKAS